MNPDTKRRMFVSTVKSVLLYGCETWTLTRTDEKTLDRLYTRLMRRALIASWEEHVRNVDLYGNLPRLTDKIRQRRMKLTGNNVRHPDLVVSAMGTSSLLSQCGRKTMPPTLMHWSVTLGSPRQQKSKPWWMTGRGGELQSITPKLVLDRKTVTNVCLKTCYNGQITLYLDVCMRCLDKDIDLSCCILICSEFLMCDVYIYLWVIKHWSMFLQ